MSKIAKAAAFSVFAAGAAVAGTVLGYLYNLIEYDNIFLDEELDSDFDI